MTGQPLVSIVTPTRNRAALLEQTLRSVNQQTYSNVEHIVMDGASADDTVNVLRRFETKYRLSWRSEVDSGMYQAVNRGLAIAEGQILGYLNSDDAYLPWAVETVVDVFEKGPDVDVVFGDGVRIDEVTGRQELRLFDDVSAQDLAVLGSLFQPAVFWRRRHFERLGGFDASLRYVGDLDFWLRSLAITRAAHVPEVLAVERVHAGALSSSQRDAMAAEDAALRARHREALNITGQQAALAQARRRWKLRQRRVWLRFLRAWRDDGQDTVNWARFRREGDLRVSSPRILLGQLPRSAPRWLPDAVRSGLAERVLRGAQAG